MNPKAKRAHWLVSQAIERGELLRPDVCELCGCNIKDYAQLLSKFGVRRRDMLQGHHWRGYDFPLDVWWVCPRCNQTLVGKHDGSLDLEAARQLVKPFDMQAEIRTWASIAVSLARKTSPSVERSFPRLLEIGRWLLSKQASGQG